MAESPFRALAHLVEQIGEDGFAALISSDNTGTVKEFVRNLPKNTTVLIGGCVYEILPYMCEGDGDHINGCTLVTRAKEMNADSGEAAGRQLLNNQKDIPVEFRGKIVFVFPEWRRPGGSSRIACVGWFGGDWVRRWDWVGLGWGGLGRLLRRK